MRLSSTSTQRTYRYVRLAIVGAVLLLLASLVVVLVTDGPVSSLSALFYTPGRGVFVGVLFAVALALVALSGHSVEQVLLDLAALFAPVIAIVPTPAASGDAPGLTIDCPGASPCVPASELAGMRNGMLSLAVVGVLGVLAAIALAVVQRTLSAGVVAALSVAGVIVIGMAAWGLAAPESFAALGHLVATGAFFGLIAAVSAIAGATARASWRGIYLTVAGGIVAALVLLGVVFGLRLGGHDPDAAAGMPLVLIGELVVVGLFLVFWVAQTVQKWDEVDPSIIADPGIR